MSTCLKHQKTPEERRYKEQANARLKDEFGASKLRVRGIAKVTCHLLFGILVLVVEQLLRLG